MVRVRNINSVVVNSLFYNGLRGFEKAKKYQKNAIFGKLFAICLQNHENHANKFENTEKSVFELAFVLHINSVFLIRIIVFMV